MSINITVTNATPTDVRPDSKLVAAIILQAEEEAVTSACRSAETGDRWVTVSALEECESKCLNKQLVSLTGLHYFRRARSAVGLLPPSRPLQDHPLTCPCLTWALKSPKEALRSHSPVRRNRLNQQPRSPKSRLWLMQPPPPKSQQGKEPTTPVQPRIARCEPVLPPTDEMLFHVTVLAVQPKPSRLTPRWASSNSSLHLSSTCPDRSSKSKAGSRVQVARAGPRAR